MNGGLRCDMMLLSKLLRAFIATTIGCVCISILIILDGARTNFGSLWTELLRFYFPLITLSVLVTSELFLYVKSLNFIELFLKGTVGLISVSLITIVFFILPTEKWITNGLGFFLFSAIIYLISILFFYLLSKIKMPPDR